MLNKIKLFGAITATIIILSACGGNDNFTISGELTGYENDSLIIQELFENALRPIQTLQLSDKGSFEYSDTAANPRFLFLQTSDNNYISLLVLEGQDIHLSVFEVLRFQQYYLLPDGPNWRVGA